MARVCTPHPAEQAQPDEIIYEGCVERERAKKWEGRKPVQGSAEGQGRPLPCCTGHSSGAVFKQIHPGKVEGKVGTTLRALGPTCPKQHGQHGGAQAEEAPTGKRESSDFRNAPAVGDEQRRCLCAPAPAVTAFCEESPNLYHVQCK